ncbi:MAG TPA: hypothetical protein VHC46_09775 [Thermodesulfobacteriota bacterium]|nr:hypothetical protein [Thermodesulfobacteriota bacterium]
MRTALSIIIPFLCLTLSARAAFAVGKETLVDLSGVAVVVDEVSSTAKADGLTGDAVKALVEDKLTRANITVLEDKKWFTVFGGSYLLVKIIASRSTDGNRYAVYVGTDLYQTVVITGKKLGKNITTAAATWSVGKLLSCETAVLRECVGGTVSDLTDMFIKDFTEVKTAKWKQEQEWREKNK